MRRRSLLAATLAIPAIPAHAQPRPIRLVVPFPPGGTVDLLGRLVAPELESRLGQTVVVENRPGAGGMIGSDAVAKSAPDGTALVISNIASHGVGAAVNRAMPYDPLRDFTHIGLIAAVPSALGVSAAGRFATLAQFLDAARASPGSVRVGSSGNGTTGHAKTEMLARAAHVELTHVPYRGAAPAVTDVIGGQTEGVIAAVADIGRNERLRLLAITSAARATRWPDVPTFKELGFPTLEANNWFGLSGPAGMDAAVAQRINAALVAALATPAMEQRLVDLGTAPNRMTPQDYTALVATELPRWAAIVREANIRAD
ncbi:tripartite tricarboxylate transporter substrate binding protein [Roseomonas sp. PWR1]|uniref:Tripartite tricarboxylate transporter substrate binding protein n=1 Tax=Roseomonas nitratireducens TaxID=2820810 RepID=A0ABS4AZS2_9PROT|nr:tripartite tricarboxylate transporter substrate-binding protein [Neoroseomonas nitratireducens]MBP0466849.1 tripartite tricarboxylate transporter substrate binding protein [Neoroseomonas nitratireducens]